MMSIVLLELISEVVLLMITSVLNQDGWLVRTLELQLVLKSCSDLVVIY